MAERNTEYNLAVILAVAETAQLQLSVSTSNPANVSSLPTVPGSGASVVRIRGTLTVVTATGGVISVNVRRGEGVNGQIIGATIKSNGTPVIGQTIPFEVVDNGTVTTGIPSPCNYTVTTSTVASAGTALLVGEIEAVQ
jgi:hypothetical protein